MEFEKPYVMGIDAGTGGIRVGVFDIKGRPLAFTSKEYGTLFPRPGWAEQDPGEWWNALVGAARCAIDESGADPEDIVAVGVDGTSSTVVCLDKNGRMVRNPILWMDNRASVQAERISSTDDRALKRFQAGVSAEGMIAKLLWMKENELEAYESAHRCMEQVDWINYRLTGEEALSINHVTHRWFYNSREGGWPIGFYRKIGLDGLEKKFPERVLPLGDIIGGLAGSAAAEIGLKPGIPVAEGGTDAYVGMLGLNVTRPGRAALIAGSSHVILGMLNKDISIKGVFGAFPDCVLPGLYVVEGGQVSSGSIMRWFMNNFIADYGNAKSGGTDPYNELNAKASSIPIGSEGLILLDYWQGNRTPYTDYQLQGAIWGLTLKHSPVHVFRAIMEGVAFGTEDTLRTLSENGRTVDSIYICGGTVKSELWLRIHADVSNLPFSITEFTEATTLGSAICAAKGSGFYKDLVEASENMVRVKRVVEPDQKKHEEYEFYFDKYRRTYGALKDLMHDMAAHERAAQERAAHVRSLH